MSKLDNVENNKLTVKIIDTKIGKIIGNSTPKNVKISYLQKNK
jgi:hypothetical protein